ncbi:hypothetical protein [Acinetobacter terrestris]|uniref:Uncharacterized protein n=1 Tax=Acinetobacter terrestris TaxID=2529843 RepID=A0ABX1UZB2_9GAMM|nr:hypothetical protein [Acinetobacter terrestris]NNH27065.1 hypothetical protein [Acinetobacter terrestris]
MESIILFAKSDLGVAIAWIATVLSLIITLWAMITKKALKVENLNLKQTIQTITQEIDNKKIKQIGKNNAYVEKNKGGIHFK